MADLAYDGRTVVAGRGLLATPAGGMSYCGAGHAGDVAMAAADLGADVVLVHDEALELLGLPRQLTAAKSDRVGRGEELAGLPFVAGAAAAGWTVYPEGWRLRLRAPQGGRWYSLVFLPYDDRARPFSGPWGAAATFSELVLGLSRFAETTGHAWRDSSGRTAERIILATHPRDKGGRRLDPHPQLPDPVAEGHVVELPYTWRRPLDEAERRCGWLHHYDANAQYLAAWAVTELGFGEPRPVAEFTGGPGVWLVEGVTLPEGDPLLPPAYLGSDGWVTTPTLLRIIEVTGAVPKIRDGWVWPEHSRYLRGAGELLRDARAQLLTEAGPAAKMARDAVKSLYAVQTGRFNMATRDERSGWHRPDWGNAIRAQARANLHRRLAGTDSRPALVWPPFAIATDGLLITSDDPDPAAWAAQIGLPVGTALGQFSVEGSCPLTPDRVEELEAATGVGRMLAKVKTWCAKEGTEDGR